MPTHSLPEGRALIAELSKLGSSLGYAVEEEHPVEWNRPNPPAVDVAWLSDPGQKYPLMIFEVESKTTNAAANNPVKVFAQDTSEFEKPLFFFHIFLSSSERSTRVDRLEQHFGSYNYKTYELDRDGQAPLIRDILSQHRRLRKDLNLAVLLDTLDNSYWEIPVDDLTTHIEDLEFEADFLNQYARRGRYNPDYRLSFIELLKNVGIHNAHEIAGYKNYTGHQWCSPIHIGLLALTEPEESDWLERLRAWQEDSSYLSMIGPHFRLSCDYDSFILAQSPVLWALIGALMYKVPGALRYVRLQMREVLDSIESARPQIVFFHAVWILHTAAPDKDEKLFSRVQSIINQEGGINPDFLLHPPAAIDIRDGEDEWSHNLQKNAEKVPGLTEFRDLQTGKYDPVSDLDESLYEAGLDVLSRFMGIHECSGAVVRCLHASTN